nr:unnamed protein product [Digitaria exilis]
MAGDDDRLSALGDSLLRRILHFVPFKEAAATSVLSRRWGSLWRSSGAVNLDVRIRNDKGEHPSYEQRQEAFFSRRDAFVRAAMAALDAADAPVTRLTLRVVDEDPHADPAERLPYRFLHCTSDRFAAAGRDVIRDVVAHRAARGVEELRVAVGAEDLFRAFDHHEIYRLSLAVPLIHLRVLDLTRCTGLTPPPPPAMDGDAFFPRLETLRLRLCSLNTSDVQALMDAAPRLATLHLETVLFSMRGWTTGEARRVRLRCLAVTELVMELCGVDDRRSIQINAPRLRYFRYKGPERTAFSLTSLAPDMVEVDAHFVLERYPCPQGLNPDGKRDAFWQFVRNFSSARVLKLKVNNLEDIAVGKARRAELLCTFRNAVRLELEGVHHATTSKAAAVAIANLLRCCPALFDLRLRLSTVPSNSFKDHEYGKAFLEREKRMDYDKSVSRFMDRRRLKPAVISSLDDNDKLDEVVTGHIPGLSGHSLTCLQTSLRKVGLQFRMDNSSCFGIKLVKFFTDNAKVLQEICVDSGNRKLCEHMVITVERRVAPNSSKVIL